LIQITAQTKVLVALEPVDFRCGIDGLAQICKARFQADPFGGTLFVFRSKRGTGIRLLCYDGQGMWLCHKRLSKGRFNWWPSAKPQSEAAQGKAAHCAASVRLLAHELQVLICGGDPTGTKVPEAWRPLV
jgi:transposase